MQYTQKLHTSQINCIAITLFTFFYKEEGKVDREFIINTTHHVLKKICSIT